MNRLLALAMIVMILPGSAWAASVKAGERLAKVKCVGCHGPTGAGDGIMLQSLGITTPPLPWNDKTKMAAFTDQQITEVITNGGKAINASPLMPAFANQLSANQIADLLAYIRSLAK